MDTTCQYQDLNEFLAKHNANARKDDPNTSNQKNTHTRIPGKNAFAGSFIIPKEEEALFYRLYYEHVFVKKKLEHLTEKQLVNDGPIIVDFDFRYSHDVEKRQHTEQHIQDLINLVYLELLKEFFIFEKNKSFPIYVMEKPNVNRLEDGSVTKDGIHIIIGIKMSKIMQEILREKVMAVINEIWDLPLVNDWESVLDLGVTKGSVPWQMYGSRKPEHEAYQLTQYYMISYDESDGQFMMEEKRISDIDLSKDLYKLSARYDQHPEFEINPLMKEAIDKRESSSVQKSLKNKRATSKTRLVLQNEPEEDELVRLEDIRNIDDLTRAVNRILSDLKISEYELKEIHEYTQILPPMFYEPGSHDLNRKVAFALKQTDDRLFLSWVMLRSKASDFDYDTIPDLYQKWTKYFKVKPDGVTKQSIMFWARQHSPEEFMRIKRNTVNYYIDETISSPTEFDFANVLYQMYKHKYVCSGIIEKSCRELYVTTVDLLIGFWDQTNTPHDASILDMLKNFVERNNLEFDEDLYEDYYTYFDYENWNGDAFNREVSRNLEKVYERLTEDMEPEELENLKKFYVMLDKLKIQIGNWSVFPKQKTFGKLDTNKIFQVVDFKDGKIKVLYKKDKSNFYGVEKMLIPIEDFTNFLYHPELF